MLQWRLHVLNVLPDFPDQNKMDTFSEWRCREREQVCISCCWVCYVWADDVLLNFTLIFSLLCLWCWHLIVFKCEINTLRIESELYYLCTTCPEEINIIFCILLGYHNVSFSLHMLFQGSYHSCWKQVWPAQWELNGNHSSHYEPVFWDWDMCRGASHDLLHVHTLQFVHQLFNMINTCDCRTSVVIKLWNGLVYGFLISALQRTWKTFLSCFTTHRKQFFTPLHLCTTPRTNRWVTDWLSEYFIRIPTHFSSPKQTNGNKKPYKNMIEWWYQTCEVLYNIRVLQLFATLVPATMDELSIH